MWLAKAEGHVSLFASSQCSIDSTLLSGALLTQGKVEAGIQLYEQALACNPQHADALYNLGVAYAETKQAYKAMFMYEMAIRFAPACAEAHNNLGVLHRDAGNLERAASCYRAALQVID